jgi:hypothetical protein
MARRIAADGLVTVSERRSIASRPRTLLRHAARPVPGGWGRRPTGQLQPERGLPQRRHTSERRHWSACLDTPAATIHSPATRVAAISPVTFASITAIVAPPRLERHRGANRSPCGLPAPVTSP